MCTRDVLPRSSPVTCVRGSDAHHSRCRRRLTLRDDMLNDLGMGQFLTHCWSREVEEKYDEPQAVVSQLYRTS
jgi:hypothetical protein